MPTKTLSKMGICIALGMMLSYIEALFPIVPSVPGVKIGLANALVVMILYSMGLKYSIMFQLCRIALSSLLFGNIFGFAYSLGGAIFSLLAMYLLKKIEILDMAGVSMVGGIFHNVAQLLIAYCIVQNSAIFYYFPILMISGSVAGYVIGWLSEFLVKRRLL